jgi:hypothetical protein
LRDVADEAEDAEPEKVRQITALANRLSRCWETLWRCRRQGRGTEKDIWKSCSPLAK